MNYFQSVWICVAHMCITIDKRYGSIGNSSKKKIHLNCLRCKGSTSQKKASSIIIGKRVMCQRKKVTIIKIVMKIFQENRLDILLYRFMILIIRRLFFYMLTNLPQMLFDVFLWMVVCEILFPIFLLWNTSLETNETEEESTR